MGEPKRTLIGSAVFGGNTAIARLVLERADGIGRRQINLPFGPKNNVYPLDVAIAKNDPTMVRLLLDKGADPNRRGGERSPLHVAAASGQGGCVAALLESNRTAPTQRPRPRQQSLSREM